MDVLSVILGRWFDQREYLRTPSCREVQNDLEKLRRISLSERQIRSHLSVFEKEGVLERRPNPERGMGHTKLIFLNREWTLQRIFDGIMLDYEGKKAFVREHNPPRNVGGWYEGTLLDPPSPDKFFLAVDKVAYSKVALPHIDFKAEVQLNYRFPKPTEILLVGRLDGTNMVLGVAQKLLEGEDILQFQLHIQPPELYTWKLIVDIYQKKRGRWCPSDSYLCRRRIHTPAIRLRKHGLWLVQSFTKPGVFYEVDTLRKSCSCPAYGYGWNPCKHMRAVETIVESLQEKWLEDITLDLEESSTLQDLILYGGTEVKPETAN